MTATATPETLRSGQVPDGVRINAYRNLNLLKQGVVGWSIQVKEKKNWIVRQHARCVLLTTVTFKHATDSQVDRVKREVREVCAWLKGTYQASCLSRHVDGIARWDEPPAVSDVLKQYRRLYCCPKQDDGQFKDFETRQVLEEVPAVFIDSDGVAWYGEVKE
jgi:hypothetical protein